MALLSILRYPDARLHKTAAPVTVFDDALRKLVVDMTETMYGAPGIGLAATQVDVHKQVIVIDVSERRDSLIVLVNPEILDATGVSDIEEGCLSVPGIYEMVERAERVKVRAYDQNGVPFTLEAQACSRFASSTRWITSKARSSSTTFRNSNSSASALAWPSSCARARRPARGTCPAARAIREEHR